jgi:hypothetical protein
MPRRDKSKPRRKPGPPPYEPSPAQRQWVTIAAAGSMPQRDMAAKLGISLPTVGRAFRAELDSALADLTVRVHANFLRIATGDSKSAAWAAERWLRMRAPEQWHDQPLAIANAGDQPFAVSFRWADATAKPESTETEPEADASTDNDP